MPTSVFDNLFNRFDDYAAADDEDGDDDGGDDDGGGDGDRTQSALQLSIASYYQSLSLLNSHFDRLIARSLDRSALDRSTAPSHDPRSLDSLVA